MQKMVETSNHIRYEFVIMTIESGLPYRFGYKDGKAEKEEI